MADKLTPVCNLDVCRVADKLRVASFWACRLPGDGVLCLAFGPVSSTLSPHQQGVLVQTANLAALQLQLQQQQRRSSHQFQKLRRRHRDLHRTSKASWSCMQRPLTCQLTLFLWDLQTGRSRVLRWQGGLLARGRGTRASPARL